MEGNLYHLIKARKGRPLAGGLVSSIFHQIVLGLDHIHSNGYFHRDMKPENVLVTTTGLFDYTSVSPVAPPHAPKEKDVVAIIKLADFGLARETRSLPPYTEYVSTRWYRAPEVLLLSRDYSNPVDMWAFGTIMAELVNLRPLFPGSDQVDQVARICEILGDPSDVYGVDLSGSQIGGGPWLKGNKLAKSIGFQFPQVCSISFDKESMVEAEFFRWSPRTFIPYLRRQFQGRWSTVFETSYAMILISDLRVDSVSSMSICRKQYPVTISPYHQGYKYRLLLLPSPQYQHMPTGPIPTHIHHWSHYLISFRPCIHILPTPCISHNNSLMLLLLTEYLILFPRLNPNSLHPRTLLSRIMTIDIPILNLTSILRRFGQIPRLIILWMLHYLKTQPIHIPTSTAVLLTCMILQWFKTPLGRQSLSTAMRTLILHRTAINWANWALYHSERSTEGGASGCLVVKSRIITLFLLWMKRAQQLCSRRHGSAQSRLAQTADRCGSHRLFVNPYKMYVMPRRSIT